MRATLEAVGRMFAKLDKHPAAVFAGIVGLVALLVVFAVGASVGHREESARAREAAVQAAAIDQRIIELVVKRNPQATIRDFAGIPALLIAESQAARMDFRLVMAIIDKESEWKPDAVSPAGAIGLMQITPPTGALIAKRLGEQFRPPVRGSTRTYSDLGSLGDPRTNIRWGIRYLSWQVDEFGIGPVALRSYNRGGSTARHHWPADRYAEDVSMAFVTLVHLFPEKR